MKSFITFTFLLLLFPVLAQKKTWLDEDGNKTDKKNAASYCFVTSEKTLNSKTGKLEKLYMTEEFYLTGERKATGSYSTKSLTRKEGFFTTYFKSGAKSGEVMYYHGLMHGNAIYFYENGNISSQANYITSKVDGPELRYYEDGTQRSSVNYTSGKLDGEGRWYFPNGQLASHEVYASDSLLSFELFYEDGTRDTISKDVETVSEFPGGKEAMKRFIRDHLNYPQVALDKGISGTVKVQFIVTSTGKISNVIVKTPAHELLNEEAIRIIKSMPDWIPGRIHGLPVNSAFNLPISFKLH